MKNANRQTSVSETQSGKLQAAPAGLFLKSGVWKFLGAAGCLVFGALPSAFACAACYGQSDSELARGMNWGIATLLGVILSVLAAISVFFVHVGRRSAAVAPEAGENSISSQAQDNS